MAIYIVKRFFMMIATILIIATLTFFLMHSIPGSPFDEERTSNPTIQANLEKFYKLDQPTHVQYFQYLKSIATFDFGPSIKKPNESVNTLLARGFPISFELGMVTILVAVLSGITLGTFAALRHNGIIDYMAMAFAVVGISVPNFVLATLLIQQFAVNWNLLPPATWSSPLHMILPTLGTCNRSDGDHCTSDTVEHAGSTDAGLYEDGAGKRIVAGPYRTSARIAKCTHAGRDNHGDNACGDFNRDIRY